MADEFAQIKEMLLGGGAFRQVNLAPLGDKILGGHGSAANPAGFSRIGMGIFYTKDRRGGNEELNKFAAACRAPPDASPGGWTRHQARGPSLNSKTEAGEHTRPGCGWTRLASNTFVHFRCANLWNFLVRPEFSARARKIARAARALPISTSEFGLMQCLRLTEHVRLQVSDTLLHAFQELLKRKNKVSVGGMMVMLFVPLPG